ncbi:hypothetical protein [Streptomyces griseorubiginosus]|uniref:hypothetical protein n=1 Tax=Streptomyces griseorubiginosus TaxID=67304 RepID=UPI002E804C9E|nr:hypothetical protein [Streptomyces griseorubiginosus]WUB43905.1 hypothetical protein OHN19_11385 [Streptomyces griseorubiginosus]WUB52423.1 hypothetical protein OG942_11380 [Streptomyces griseorubiginosus]
MHKAGVPFAAPPGGVVSPVAFGVIGAVLVALVVVNLLIAWGLVVSADNPARYPKISVGEAEVIAGEEGFTPQTHDTKGMWLFLRRVSD